MTLEPSINQENPGVDKTCHLIQKGGHLQLVADFTIESDRKIYGVAHVPVIDRENELILADAIRKALPEYMKLPILHVQHTERPVGTVTKAYVDDDGKLHIHADIKDSEDTDDVWADIVSGELNKFSIFGKRLTASPECALAPAQRITPCVTKALTLFSISVVGDNAMNQQTFLEVAKAQESGRMTEEEEKKNEEEEVEKSEEEPGLLHEPGNMSSVLGRIDELEKCNAGLKKSIDDLYQMANPVEKSEDEEDDKVEEKKDETVEKAAPVEDEKDRVVETPDFITKAALDGYVTKAELDTIQKAHDELKKAYDELTERVTKMENETIEKGGNVVIIEKSFIDDNPHVGNLQAIGGN